MPYTDRLKEFAEWFRQLWAESLGKRVDRNGRVVNTGSTPVGAIGATDQHSQVQLFMEGPYDKVITFVAVQDLGEDVADPTASRPSGRPGVPSRSHPWRVAASRIRGDVGRAVPDGTHELLAASARPERGNAR